MEERPTVEETPNDLVDASTLEQDIIPQLDYYKKIINPNMKVLNITHKNCVDGATSQIALKNYFNNIWLMESTYYEIDEVMRNVDTTDYDLVIVSDISPATIDLVEKHDNIILLDHHESALKPVNFHCPEKHRYVYKKECGAALTKRFLETALGIDLSYLDRIIYLANDYDLWIHDDPKSKEFALLFYKYWNNKFIKRFFNGESEWTEDEKEFIRKRNHELEVEWSNTEVYEFGSINGCICYGELFINDICDRLLTREEFDVVIYRNTKNKNVSVRSRGSVDIGGLVSELGIGGGHKNAGGIAEKDVIVLMDKIKNVEKELYKRYPHIRT